MVDADFFFTLCFLALAVNAAWNPKILGASVVLGLALVTVYPNMDAAGLLVGAGLGVVNFLASVRE